MAITVDLQREDVDLKTVVGFIDFSAPYLPVVGLLISPLIGAAAWLVAVILLLLIGVKGILLFAIIVPTIFVLLAVTTTFPARQATGFLGIVLAFHLFTALSLPAGVGPLLGILLPLYLVVGLSGLTINRQLNKIRERDIEIEDLRERQIRVRNEERQKLAFELHDIVAHDITIIAMQARRAQYVTDPEKTQHILDGIGNAAQQTLQDLRSLLVLLKTAQENAPDVTADESADLLETPEVSGETTTAVGFVKDLNNVIDALQRAGFTVEQRIQGEVAQIPASLRQALRRTIREMGTNILKHGSTQGSAVLSLTIINTHVTLSASNHISRAAPMMSTQTGLEALRARAEVFEGTVSAGHIENEKDQIWETTVTIPLHGNNVTQPQHNFVTSGKETE
ncbi:sensor histidine kinase [Timonella sp. A28]|uniref:sensor histidine kinase n=1 Tax=Timonella sp. A28 TaxID=3442640 RepID=UPI003EB9BCCB